MRKEIIAALDVGGTHVSGALVDSSTWTVVPDTWHSIDLESSGPAEPILQAFTRCFEEVTKTTDVSLLGISMPGPFDYAAGIGRFEGVAKFDSLNGVNIHDELLARLPSVEAVGFINDAVAFTLGEWKSGEAKDCQRVIGITLGTGVGSAFLEDGVPVDAGDIVPPEGAVYHLTINDQPLEETVSRRAIRANYAASSGDNSGLDVREIAELARSGNESAAKVIAYAFTELGITLKPWVQSFDPQIIVFGGAISPSWDLIEPALAVGLGEREKLLRLSTLRGDAAMIGAAWAARKK